MNIYIFGNPLVSFDSFPIRMLPSLQKTFPNIEFVVEDPNANFPPQDERNPIIIDSVRRLLSATLIQVSDLVDMKKTPISPHDYDLLFHLHLLKKMKKIDSAHIIAVPQVGDETEMRNQVCDIITTLLAKNEMHRTCTDQMHE